jgi:transposase
MNDRKYVGMDVHAATIVLVVRGADGAIISESVLRTEASAIRDFLRGLSGRVEVTFEEGTHAAWLYDLLSPLVARLLVCNPRENRSGASTTKSDRIDARKLSEWLYKGTLKSVYHGDRCTRRLTHLLRAYEDLVADATRAKNRLKAIFRSQAIATRGTALFTAHGCQTLSAKLADSGERERALLLARQLEALSLVLADAKRAVRAECRRQPAYHLLRSIPGLGDIRVAQIISAVKTPHRFRRNRHLWSYAGLAVVTSSSADHVVVDGQLRPRPRAALTRGLNTNGNRRLKDALKGAAQTASRRGELKHLYEAQIANGTRPQLAQLTLARKIATLALTCWKKGECFDVEKLTRHRAQEPV